MKIANLLLVFLFVVFSTNSFSYGGSSGTKSCTKPKFKEFNPVHLTAAAPQSEFSFTASTITSPSSIKVSVKKIPVNVEIQKTKKGYLITGKLPGSLVDTFARVDIEATSKSKCFGSDGWLIKIDG